jgi:hypothetical protein
MSIVGVDKYDLQDPTRVPLSVLAQWNIRIGNSLVHIHMGCLPPSTFLKLMKLCMAT